MKLLESDRCGEVVQALRLRTKMIASHNLLLLCNLIMHYCIHIMIGTIYRISSENYVNWLWYNYFRLLYISTVFLLYFLYSCCCFFCSLFYIFYREGERLFLYFRCMLGGVHSHTCDWPNHWNSDHVFECARKLYDNRIEEEKKLRINFLQT